MTTKDYQTRSPLRIFLSYFKPHRRLFALDLSCAFLIACIDLAFPLVSRAAMYTWLPQRQFRVFFIVMAVVVAAYVLRSALYFVVAYWGHTFGIRVEADIRRDLYRHIQELGFDFYDRNRTGQLMSRLTSDLFELTELAHHGPEDLFISLVTIVGALAVMFTLRWELALVLLVLLPVLLTMALRRRRQMSAASRAAKVKTGTINAAIESGLSGVRTTKAFANEEAQQQRFDEANEVFKTAKRGFHKEMGRFNAVMEFCTGILPVAVIAVGGWLIMGEKMDYVDLITFSLYVTAFVSPIRKLANFAEMFSNGFAGLHRLSSSTEMKYTNRFGKQGEAWDIKEDGSVVELTPDILSEDFTIENYKYTYGMVGLGSYITKEENAEVLKENSFTSWYRIDCVKQLHDYCVPVENQLPIRFVDPEKTSERTFIETELFSYISNFIATSVMDGIDDAAWEAHLQQLDAVQYNEWLNWYQGYLDKEF